jgi:glycine/D-amino acid oxidase-like deaminating enzyme
MSDQYDVVVIGAGPAGYPCAVRAAQNKLKVACIDEWKNLDGSYAYGGTCLNAGCIPSKALLESTELFHRAQTEFSAHGIKVGELGFDVATMQKRKAQIVKASTQGITGLFKAAGVSSVPPVTPALSMATPAIPHGMQPSSPEWRGIICMPHAIVKQTVLYDHITYIISYLSDDIKATNASTGGSGLRCPNACRRAAGPGRRIGPRAR